MLALVALASSALVVVFLVSAISKVVDIAGTRAMLQQVGLPNGLALALTAPLLLSEAAVVVLLVVPGTLRAGCLAALLLVVVFSATLSLALRSGRRPQCRCFGRLSKSPVGRQLFIRNGIIPLAAIPGLLPGSPASLGRAIAAVNIVDLLVLLAVALFATIAVLLWSQAQILVSHGQALERLARAEQLLGISSEDSHAPLVGQRAPDLTLASADGRSLVLSNLWSSADVLLVFLSKTCASCRHVSPAVMKWQRSHREEVSM